MTDFNDLKSIIEKLYAGIEVIDDDFNCISVSDNIMGTYTVFSKKMYNLTGAISSMIITNRKNKGLSPATGKPIEIWFDEYADFERTLNSSSVEYSVVNSVDDMAARKKLVGYGKY